jgi:hypothetical protein
MQSKKKKGGMAFPLLLAAAIAQSPCVPRYPVDDALLAQYRQNNASIPYPIPQWSVSAVTNFSHLFKNQAAANPDVSGWDVSAGRHFDGMFDGAASFNVPLSSWDVSSATSFSRFLAGATSFNQPIDFDAPNAIFFDSFLEDAISMASPVRISAAFNPQLTFASLLKNATSFNNALDLSPLESAASVSSILEDAVSFNQRLPWQHLNENATTADILAGATAFQWSLGCWPVYPPGAPNQNCSARYPFACVDCSPPSPASSDDRALYLASLIIVLCSASYHFILLKN